MAVRVIAPAADDTAASLVAAVRAGGAGAEAIIVEVAPGIAALERHLMLAAITPLAIELAPATRLCAIDIGEGAAPEDVAALRDFLAGADCTTGQVVQVTGA